MPGKSSDDGEGDSCNWFYICILTEIDQSEEQLTPRSFNISRPLLRSWARKPRGWTPARRTLESMITSRGFRLLAIESQRHIKKSLFKRILQSTQTVVDLPDYFFSFGLELADRVEQKFWDNFPGKLAA